MNSTITDLSVFLNAFGAGNGIFWGYLLLSRKKTPLSHYFLATLLFLFAIFIINTIIKLSGYGESLALYQDLANTLTFLIGPLLWAYIQAGTDHHSESLRRFWIHCLPFLFLLPTVFINDVRWDAQYFLKEWLFYLWNAQMAIYLMLAFRKLNHQKNHFSLPLIFLRYFTAIWLLNLILLLVKIHWYPLPDIIFLNVTLLFNLLIFAVALRTFTENRQPQNAFSLPESKYQEVAGRLEKIMEEVRPYRNPDLTIRELAEMAGLPSRYVSATLNRQFGQTFYEFVNAYRIKEIKETLSDPDSLRYTIGGIADEAGFRSVSAFYKAFRRFTGMTPGEFRNRIRKD